MGGQEVTAKGQKPKTLPAPEPSAEELKRLNAQFYQHRANLGLTPEGRATVRAVPADALCRPNDLPQRFGPAPTLDSLVKVGGYRCIARLPTGKVCGKKINTPGICEVCGKREETEAEDREHQARLDLAIPPLYQDVTWEALPTLMNEDGTEPRVALSPQQIEDVREAFATHPRIILLGPAGGGKSSLAAAHVRAALDDKIVNARFFSARALVDKPGGDPLEELICRSANRATVIDDLGTEFHGAPAGGGLAAQRIVVIDNALRDRHERKLGYIITTEYDRPRIEHFYGDGLARRIFEGAIIIPVGRKQAA
jgi:DNA replication protein DnaC